VAMPRPKPEPAPVTIAILLARRSARRGGAVFKVVTAGERNSGAIICVHRLVACALGQHLHARVVSSTRGV
jgi:hypothetical protein